MSIVRWACLDGHVTVRLCYECVHEPADAAGSTGDRGVLINGFCTTGIPNNPVTGSNVLVATRHVQRLSRWQRLALSWTSTAAMMCSERPLPDMADKQSRTPILSRTLTLTDGAPMCAPTAVTMTGFGANNANPAAGGVMALWPLLAGGAAVVAGGAYALSRRKR